MLECPLEQKVERCYEASDNREPEEMSAARLPPNVCGDALDPVRGRTLRVVSASHLTKTVTLI
jgi:hypothetical protein